jgi:hypothetical protein
VVDHRGSSNPEPPPRPAVYLGADDGIPDRHERKLAESQTRSAFPKPEDRFWGYVDKAVLSLFEVLALLFALPFGDALFHDKPVTNLYILYLVIGCLFAIGGPMFPLTRSVTWIPKGVAPTISAAARDARIWIFVLLVFFLYGVAPDIYQRATTKLASAAPPAAGFTQLQVDSKAAEAVKPLQERIIALQNENDGLRRASQKPPMQSPSASQPSQSKFTAAEIATKIGVWGAIRRHMDEFTGLLNLGYSIHDSWWASAQEDRDSQIRNITSLATRFETFRAKLDQLRDLYTDDPDVAAALKPVLLPPGRPMPPYTMFYLLNKSIEAYAHHLRAMPGPLPANAESEMFTFVGAFKRSLDNMSAWKTEVIQAAGKQEKLLSEMEPK